jgi:hypothetical protein
VCSMKSSAKKLRIDSVTEFASELVLFKECLKLSVDTETCRVISDSRCTAWIASGLSKVAAECGRRMLQNRTGVPGRLFTPLDYYSSNHRQYLPVLVSYHGKNHDIQAAANSLVKAEHKRAVLIAGYESTPVRAYLEDNGVEVHTIFLPEHQEDKRFVSVMATWALSALCLRVAQAVGSQKVADLEDGVDAAYEQARSAAALTGESFNQIEDWSNRKWIVLGTGSAAPAMLAWEAMCAESALLSVVIADLKDYTHGRYLSALREKTVGFVILSDEMNADVARIIKDRFSQLFPVIELNSRGDELFSLCHQLFLVTMIVSGLARGAGHSLTSPPKPPFIRSWNNWGKIKSFIPGG